jgi:hypothetical protein
MAKQKMCFKCNEIKELGDFYKHPLMPDGRVNKCKDCAKLEVRARHEKLKNKPEYMESEKIRGREKYHRLYAGLKKPKGFYREKKNNKHREKYPEKYAASNASQRIPKVEKSNQLHHWSYNEEHYKDVIELSISEHNKLHRYIVYDQERKMYRRSDNNVLLDTKESHLIYYKSLKAKP